MLIMVFSRHKLYYSCPFPKGATIILSVPSVCVSVCLPHFQPCMTCTNLILYTVIAGTESQKKFKYHGDWTYTFSYRGQSSITPMLKAWQVFRPYISKTMRGTNLTCITDIYEIIYGLSFRKGYLKSLSC